MKIIKFNNKLLNLGGILISIPKYDPDIPAPDGVLNTTQRCEIG